MSGVTPGLDFRVVADWLRRRQGRMLLNSLDRVGGEEYFARLAIENSSAYASLLGKIVPHTIAPASENDGGDRYKITFTRIIVHPGGHREVEGVTPKALAAPPDASQTD